jgi:hypothetical protein
MKKENKFAAINRPKDVRVNNLGAAKETVNAVGIFYRIKGIRVQKLKLIDDLNKEVQGLQLLFAKLYDFLPEHGTLELKKIKNVTTKKKKTKTTKIPTSDKQIDKLEQSLSMIEQKLKKL